MAIPPTHNSIDTHYPIEIASGGNAGLDDGEFVIGSTGAAAIAGTLSSTSGTITTTAGANSLSVDVNAGIATDTGFATWGGAGNYYDAGTLGSVTVLRPGTGYINGELISWTAPQTATGIATGTTVFIYIDSTGTIQQTATPSLSLYQDNILLFECLRDSTGTNNQFVVKENHPFAFQPTVSYWAHEIIGTVIENNENGANIALNGVDQIQINGDDVLSDHGLYTTIPDSAATGVLFAQMYTLGSGKWAAHAAGTATFGSVYNNGGSVDPLGASKFGIYTLYVSKDDLTTTTPRYFAVIGDAQYNNITAAQTAIASGLNAQASNELSALEICQLGTIIYSESAAAIVQVNIQKTTLKSSISTAGTNQAALVNTSVTNFDYILSAADTTVQAALDTIDNWPAATAQYDVMISGGAGNLVGAATPSATSGISLISQGAAADPIFGTVVVAGGGTGATTLTGVLTGNGTGAVTANTVTQYGTVVAGASNAVSSIAPSATSGVPLISQGAAANPAYGTAVVAGGGTGATTLTGVLTGNGTGAVTANTITQYGTVVAGASNAVSSVAPSGTSGVPLISQGAAANPAYGTAVVAGGGTGAVTLTSHGVLLGQGTSAISSTAEGATGTVLIGTTGANASFSASPTVTTMNATTFDTNVAAAGVTLSGTSLVADGTDANIPITITPKGSGPVTIDGLDYPVADGAAGTCMVTSGAGVLSLGTLTVPGGGTGATTLTGVLTGNGAGAVTANTVTQYGTVVAGASNAVSSIAPSATSGVPLISQGSSSNPTFGTAVVAGGGTGLTTVTAGNILYGNGTSALGNETDLSWNATDNILSISPAALQSRKIVLYETADNDHQFYGFGLNSNVMRYQGGDTACDHIFYVATSNTTSDEIMRIQGTGQVAIGGFNYPKSGAGSGKFGIDGADSDDADGPFAQFTTDTDAYPLLTIFPYSHDSVSILFDAYNSGGGGIRSSDVGSNFKISKESNVFKLDYDSGISVGAGITWNTGLFLDIAGNIVIGPAGALGTTVTNGFLHIPSCAGTPTGTPDLYTGKIPVVFDSTNNKLYVYDGSWIAIN